LLNLSRSADVRIKPRSNQRMKAGQWHRRHLTMHKHGALLSLA
jgi:ribosomal protein L35